MDKKLGIGASVIAGLVLGGCASAPKYHYGATPDSSQSVLVAKTNADTPPRLVSKKHNILMAEPREATCDGSTEFAFNVVFANRQDHAVSIGPDNFKVSYLARTFAAMPEKDVEKQIHHDDWVKNSILVVGIIGGIAGAAAGDYAGASNLLMQTGADYSTLDAEQNSEFEKYRNKVFALKSVNPKDTYGGLVIAMVDQAGKGYAFDAANVSADIDLTVSVDGDTDHLLFNCSGEPPAAPTNTTTAATSTAHPPG
jgi:hypothetical protein